MLHAMTLKALREGAGLTLKTVAARCEMHKQYVSLLELGGVPNPRYVTVEKLAAALASDTKSVYLAIRESVRARAERAA